MTAAKRGSAPSSFTAGASTKLSNTASAIGNTSRPKRKGRNDCCGGMPGGGREVLQLTLHHYLTAIRIGSSQPW